MNNRIQQQAPKPNRRNEKRKERGTRKSTGQSITSNLLNGFDFTMKGQTRVGGTQRSIQLQHQTMNKRLTVGERGKPRKLTQKGGPPPAPRSGCKSSQSKKEGRKGQIPSKGKSRSENNGVIGKKFLSKSNGKKQGLDYKIWKRGGLRIPGKQTCRRPLSSV